MATLSTDIAQTLDITARRGDTCQFKINFKNAAGTAPIDTTGYTFLMEIRPNNLSDVANNALTTAGANNSVPTTGVVMFTILASSMRDLPGGEYVYDIQARKDEATSNTWVTGDFIVEEDVSVEGPGQL